MELPAFAEAREPWLRELEGPFRVDARICLERQGLETLDNLLTAWNNLAEENREWLVDWVLRSEPSAHNKPRWAPVVQQLRKRLRI